MAVTYTPIATTTIGSVTNSYTFSTISSGYTDLIIIVGGSADGTNAANILLQFNSDTATNYSTTILYGDGSSAGSVRVTNAANMNIGDLDTGTSTAVSRINIMNYANTSTYKTVLGRADRSVNSVAAKVGLWRNTAAITTVKVFLSSSINFSVGTTLTLYGIAAA